MEWMLDIQLGRHNLFPVQRIAVVEKNVFTTKRKQKKNKQNIMVINMTKEVDFHQNWCKYKIVAHLIKVKILPKV